MHDPAAQRVAPRHLLSPLAITTALLAALILSLLPAAPAIAATPAPAPAAADPSAAPRGSDGPGKAVIIVGPVEGLTSSYLGYGELWADRAEAQGMDVRRVFSPYATWSNVLANIQGAKLVVFLGHGNGWPSPYSPFQEDTKDGFGLNSSSGSGHYNVKYYGANFIRSSVTLGENAIVVLGHACYSAGTGEQWQAEPTVSVAKERVDNFASGFLAAGASTYFAYYYEQTRNMVADLFTQDKTMDELFMQPGGSGTYSGFSGTNDPYYASVRTPGARIHLDQAPGYGWYRAVAGDLDMTTDEWRGEPDLISPELTRFDAVASTVTYATAATAKAPPVVFTPNGDGVTEAIGVDTHLTEGAYVTVVVRDRSDSSIVRRFTTWVAQGAGKVTWDGRRTDSTYVADGDYRVVATPKDRAGNVGASVSADVAVRTSLRSPVAKPALFFPSDGDKLADSTTLGITVAQTAVVTWKLVDAAGGVVAVQLDAIETAPGVLSWTWDGKKTDGSWARNGVYWSTVTATTAAGTYSHRYPITLSAFKLWAAVTSSAPGRQISFSISSAEALRQNPTVRVTQPGLTPYTISTTKTGTNLYRAEITFRSGGAGVAKLRVMGYDRNGAAQSSDFKFTVN